RVLEPRAAVQREERLPGEREFDDEHAPRLAARAVHDIPLHMLDARTRQQRHIEFRRFFRFAVEPQTGGDLRHRRAPILVKRDDGWGWGQTWATLARRLGMALCYCRARASERFVRRPANIATAAPIASPAPASTQPR